MIVTVGSSSVEVQPHTTSTPSKSVIDLHLELFLDDTKKLAQSVVECLKENKVNQSIDEVVDSAMLTSLII